jgi:hypothetical protein
MLPHDWLPSSPIPEFRWFLNPPPVPEPSMGRSTVLIYCALYGSLAVLLLMLNFSVGFSSLWSWL